MKLVITHFQLFGMIIVKLFEDLLVHELVQFDLRNKIEWMGEGGEKKGNQKEGHPKRGGSFSKEGLFWARFKRWALLFAKKRGPQKSPQGSFEKIP